MNQNIILAIIEFGASLIVEGVILSMVFTWIANNQNEKQQKSLQKEMNNIESLYKNPFQYDKKDFKDMTDWIVK